MSEAVTETAARSRCSRIKLLLESMTDLREKVLSLITEAKESGDHAALGYPSWTAYVREEYADLLAKLNREDRREAVLTLSDTGMSTRAIAGVVGVGDATVRRDLSGASTDAPETVTAPAKSKVVGMDGKRYAKRAPKPRKAPNCRPLPDDYRTAVHDLEKVVARLERLHQDDRFDRNREAVREHSIATIHRCQTRLRRMIAELGGGS